MSVSKNDVARSIKAAGLVPVYYNQDVDALVRSVAVSYKCGLRIFEFMHQRDNKGLRYFEHLVSRLDEFPDMILGVGTVLDAIMTERYIRSGAQFIASPFLRPDMGEVCERQNVLWMPGCSAVAEVEKAHALGATVINVLPGNVLGPEFIAPLARRYHDMKFIPSGISDLRESELQRWFAAGAFGIKLGQQVFAKDLVLSNDWKTIENNLLGLLKSIKKIQAMVKPVNLDSISE